MINQEALGKKIPTYADIVHEVFSFAGGLNTRASQLFMSQSSMFAMQPDQMTLANNIIRTKTGMAQTRPGRVKVNATPVTPGSGDAVIRSMYELRRTDGVDRICMNAGNTFYRLNGSTWTSVGTFVTPNLRRSYCQFKEALFGVDGVNDMMKYDGTTLSTIAAAPKGTAMAAHRDRLWIIVGKSLRFCVLGDETDWTTTGSATGSGTLPIPVTKGTGGTALIPMWDRLIILCGEQIFQLAGTSATDFAITPINLAYGSKMSCYGPSAAGNDIYFGDSKGIHGLSVTESQNLLGDVSYNYISGLVEPTWQDIAPNNLPNSFSLHDKKHNMVLFFYSGSNTTNEAALVADYYHLDQRSMPTWTAYTNMPFACGAEVESLGGGDLLFGGYDGIVYRQDDSVETDDGVPIPFQLEYITDLQLPQFSKTLRHLMMFSDVLGGTMTITVAFDFGTHNITKTVSFEGSGSLVVGGPWILGQTVLGNAAFKQHRVAIPGHGRLVKILFSYNGPNRVSLGGFMVLGGIRRLITV